MLAAGLDRPDLVAIAGGEALPGPLADELTGACARLVNVYGPTETTVWATLAHLTTGAPVTIGRPLAATRAYVLDARGNPYPTTSPANSTSAGRAWPTDTGGAPA